VKTPAKKSAPETKNKWKSGDQVRLKSGGPTMTVDRYVRPYDAETGPSAAIVTKCVFFQTQNSASRLAAAGSACSA
jgi:uncharacterized protein YodC (DUF2158 family)